MRCTTQVSAQRSSSARTIATSKGFWMLVATLSPRAAAGLLAAIRTRSSDPLMNPAQLAAFTYSRSPE